MKCFMEWFCCGDMSCLFFDSIMEHLLLMEMYAVSLFKITDFFVLLYLFSGMPD